MGRLLRRRLAPDHSLRSCRLSVVTASLAVAALAFAASGRAQGEGIAFLGVPSSLSRATLRTASTPSVASRPATGSDGVQYAEAAPAWPACLLAAGALATLCGRGFSRRPQKALSAASARVVATHSLPILPATVCKAIAPTSSAFFSLLDGDVAAASPPQVKDFSVPASSRTFSADKPQDVPRSSGARCATKPPPRQEERQRQRRDEKDERRERRRVGGKLQSRLTAEPHPLSYEPSKVPLRLQRALQLRSFPRSSSGHEAKQQAEAPGPAASLDIGLQMFKIYCMVLSTH